MTPTMTMATATDDTIRVTRLSTNKWKKSSTICLIANMVPIMEPHMFDTIWISMYCTYHTVEFTHDWKSSSAYILDFQKFNYRNMPAGPGCDILYDNHVLNDDPTQAKNAWGIPQTSLLSPLSTSKLEDNRINNGHRYISILYIIIYTIHKYR